MTWLESALTQSGLVVCREHKVDIAGPGLTGGKIDRVEADSAQARRNQDKSSQVGCQDKLGRV